MSTSTLRPIIVGTAGHIDHGKSALVRALTGTDPDRLAEEKRRGITIELGFAHLTLPDNTVLGLVDVPGHERFVRQMIAGASGIDIALLCIAADDGIMPQTREHLAVLQLLGINTCIVALTKCDLVDDDWRSLIQEEVQAELARTPYANAPIVAVSARNNTGLDELKETLTESVRTLERTSKEGPVRMPIDRVFTIKGSGTVVTGTLWQGTIRPDDELEILPQNRIARVRAIQVHGSNAASSNAGVRTALNLASLSKSDLKPGDFLTTPSTQQTSDRFDARFTSLPVLTEEKSLVSGTRVHVAHGTREVTGRLLYMDGKETINAHETTYAQIRLDEPLPVMRGDRFIIRSLSPARVIGGGTVLNSYPRRRTTLKAEEEALLGALTRDDDAALCAAIIDTNPLPTSIAELARVSAMNPEHISDVLTQLTTGKGKPIYIPLGQGSHLYFAKRSTIQNCVMSLENTMLIFHGENPSATGISKNALRQRYPHHLDETCFDALLTEAIKDKKLVVIKGEISHPSAGAGARALEEQTANTLLGLLRSHGATPPSLPELFEEAGLDQARGAKAILLLEEQGRAQRVNKTLCLSDKALESFWNAAHDYLEEHGSATAAQLKEAMKTSRKFAIPLLEYFDEKKLTLRQGDMRVLTNRSS
ncbi:MAG: selenocysteine-specific translation elongation factor [Eggerthellaceae bacterium]